MIAATENVTTALASFPQAQYLRSMVRRFTAEPELTEFYGQELGVDVIASELKAMVDSHTRYMVARRDGVDPQEGDRPLTRQEATILLTQLVPLDQAVKEHHGFQKVTRTKPKPKPKVEHKPKAPVTASRTVPKGMVRQYLVNRRPLPALGLYWWRSEIVRIRRKNNGFAVAEMLIMPPVDGNGHAVEDARWEDVGLTMYDISQEGNPMPVDDAIEFGKLTHLCVRCGDKLTDPASVKRGMGRQCEAAWGL